MTWSAMTASLSARTLSATGRPAARYTFLVRSLSIAKDDANTPECVYGRPIHSRMPCTQPSSPQRPCRPLNTTSGAISERRIGRSRPASTSITSNPTSRKAAAHSRPELRETSRSAEGPPISTATFGDVLLDIPNRLLFRVPAEIAVPFCFMFLATCLWSPKYRV